MSILKLGKLVMERRGSEGVREFAKKLGVSPATLSRVENGKLPDLETFSKICDKLDLTLPKSCKLAKNPPRTRKLPLPHRRRCMFISALIPIKTPKPRKIWRS